jgi:hypothetical protein
MKRIITAVSFAVLAVPAVAQPFEQTELDRAVPQIADNASAGASRSRTDRGLPFEQSELDRALAGVSVKQRDARAAAQPWVDYNFIAPAL